MNKDSAKFLKISSSFKKNLFLLIAIPKIACLNSVKSLKNDRYKAKNNEKFLLFQKLIKKRIN